MNQNWRQEYPVLVAEAHSLGAIAVIRSLGAAGYPVHSCSADPTALGLVSRYNSASTVCPDYEDPGFADWLAEYVRVHRIKAIVPSEGFLLVIRARFSEFASLLPYSSSESVVYAGMSKADQIATFVNTPEPSKASAHLPPFLLLDNPAQKPNETDLAGLGFPLYIKVDGVYSRGKSISTVVKATTMKQAQEQLEDLLPRYRKILVEGHVPGKGVGAFFLIWEGMIRAEFMHERLHEVPHTGGVSSYRKTWWHEGVRSDAYAKLSAMNWQGVAMMEYRWDPATDEFYFLEMNGRFWGSLHLALHAGVDFPAYLLDSFHGLQIRWEKHRIKNVSCRYTFPREVMYVWSCWKDSSLALSVKLRVLLEFVALGLNPQVYSDLWFSGDRRLYWRQLWRFFGDLAKAALGRVGVR